MTRKNHSNSAPAAPTMIVDDRAVDNLSEPAPGDDNVQAQLQELEGEQKKKFFRREIEFTQRMAPHVPRIKEALARLRADQPAIETLARETLSRYPERPRYQTEKVKAANLALRKEARGALDYLSQNIPALTRLLDEITDEAREHIADYSIDAMVDQDLHRLNAMINVITYASFAEQIAQKEAAFKDAVKRAVEQQRNGNAPPPPESLPTIGPNVGPFTGVTTNIGRDD